MTSAVADAQTVSQALAQGADALGTALPSGALSQLSAYVALLLKWNRVYNLTAIREPLRVVTHHLLDSLAVLPVLQNALRAGQDVRLLDIGSGAGLPGLVLAIACPGWYVVMSESSRKKGAFIVQGAAELGVRNAEVAIGRVEDYRPAALFDIVIARAFADLATFVRAASRYVAKSGVIVAMKGAYPRAEIEALPAAIRVLAVPRLDVPGLDAERHLVLMQPEPQV